MSERTLDEWKEIACKAGEDIRGTCKSIDSVLQEVTGDDDVTLKDLPLEACYVLDEIADNPYLMGTNYMNTLQSLPEPLRSQMLNGDFKAGCRDEDGDDE